MYGADVIMPAGLIGTFTAPAAVAVVVGTCCFEHVLLLSDLAVVLPPAHLHWLIWYICLQSHP
jgi:hypothetical protein